MGRKTKKKIEQRKRVGKTLKSHFSDLPNTSLSSWKDEALPNILWAICLRGNLEQSVALKLFRKVITRFRERFNGRNDVSLCHDNLGVISDADFDHLFQDVLTDKNAKVFLRPLALLDSLPDSHHWRRNLGEIEENEIDWSNLATSLARCLYHQSQESTDVRWLKVVSFCVIGRLYVRPEDIDHLRLYPAEGDQRSVRPMIRATEMTLRNFETGSERNTAIDPMDVEGFWDELHRRTPCAMSAKVFEKPPSPELIQSEISETLQAIGDHFFSCTATTSVDPRMDGAFGIALNSISLCYEVSISPSQVLAGGRILLRSIVEAFITLAFLEKKDDATLWAQYRNYGAGQTVLAFIKNSDDGDWPSFIDAKRLEMLANEDIWHEMRDIDIGSWANTDLRKMSDFAGVKDVYDKYYDWASGYSHGHWGCVRDSTLTTCMNPLHRLHRIPAGTVQLPSVLEDCCKISNRVVDLLNSLYPGLKKRIDWKTNSDTFSEIKKGVD